MILIDPPWVPWRGTTWSHLASDSSLDELHTFAARHGIPERGFDRDHYDVPAEHHHEMIRCGALLVPSRELVVRLRSAGLRRPKPLA